MIDRFQKAKDIAKVLQANCNW